MSYILDALRKVERQRQLGTVPSVATVHAPPRPGRRFWVLTAVVVVLANAALWLIVVAPRPGGPPESSPASPVPAPVAVSGPVAPPAAARHAPPPSREPVVAARVETPGEVVRPAHAPDEGRQPAAPLSRRDAMEPPETRSAAPAATSPTPVAPLAPPRMAIPMTERRGSPPPVPAPASVVSPPGPEELPADFREAVARLRLEVLVFAERAAERQVFINGRKYHQGQMIDEMIVVEEIVDEGVVLAWRGHRHLLRHSR